MGIRRKEKPTKTWAEELREALEIGCRKWQSET